jgi:GPH family glycoside/pentoside/hexuronide:cation symporter
MSQSMHQRDKVSSLTLGQVIGYGAGDFAFNLSFSFFSLFLLYFYTDVLGLSATTAGLIIMVALIWEGVTDPIIGIIVNRTRSRWGRYRPYLLFGAIPLGLSVVAMFLPLKLDPASLVAYSFATHMLYRTIFSFVNIPYISLSAQMTRDSAVRGKLAAARMIFAILCGLTMAAFTLPLAKTFGGGRVGFFYVSVVYSLIATAILLLCFARTSEATQPDELGHVGVRAMLETLRVNWPLLVLLLATVMGSSAFTMAGKALVYYVKYWSGSESMVTLGLVIVLGTAALAMVPWVWLSRMTSKRNIWLAGASINVAAYLALFLLAPKAGALLWVLLALTGIGNAAFILTFWSMLPDTVEFGEWKTGVRTEGAVFGLVSFVQKVAFGLGTGLIGLLLDHFGYVANQAQSMQTLHGIIATYALGPMLLFAGSILVIWWYPIDRATHARLVSEINDRRMGSGSNPSTLKSQGGVT